jgi:hypothetical protein
MKNGNWAPKKKKPKRKMGKTPRSQRQRRSNEKYHIEHVKYREECLGNVVSSSTANAFSTSVYVLNIGNLTTHPIASTQAPMFQRFRYRKLNFRFETMSATAIASSTSSTLGSTLMNWQPDPTAVAFPDQIHMEEFGMVGRKRICKERVISKDNFFSVDCTSKNDLEPDNWLYVLPNSTGTAVSIPATASIHEYTHGFFTMASVGVQGTSQVLGRLFVGVELDFAICSVPPANTTTLFAHYFTSTPTSANNFNGMVLQPGSTLTGGTITISGGYAFPSTVSNGQFLIMLVYNASTTATSASWTMPGSKCISYGLIGGSGLADQSGNLSLGVTGNSMTLQFISVNGVAPAIALGTPSTLTGPLSVDMYIVGLPLGISSLGPQTLAIDTLADKLERQQKQITRLMQLLDAEASASSVKRICAPSVSESDDDEFKTCSSSSSSSSSLSDSTILSRVVEAVRSSSHKKS